MTWRDGRVSFVILPPFVKGMAGADVKALFGWGSFSKRVAYVGVKDKHIFGSCNSVEWVRACLINAVSVNFIENFD